MVNAKLIFGGIEGGGTHSWIVLVDGRGEKMAELEGPSTNHWLIGINECQKRIWQLITDAKKMAGLPMDTTLEALGLCLSGCEDEAANREMGAGLMRRYPELTKHVVVASDTQGSIATACHNGGIVLISGTGSNALLLNPDGKTFRCGGWGHLLGDEGGAYWIAARAVKLLFDEDDNMVDPPYNTNRLREIVYSHFELKDRFGMLEHCYASFQKAKFAGLTAKLSRGASEGDAMCARILYDAGFALGRHIAALSRNIDDALLSSEDGLKIVCSGSVWKSWEHMRAGFVDGIQPRCDKDRIIPKFTLLRLAVTSALGAIYLGAKEANYELPRDYSKNVRAFFTYIHPSPVSVTKVVSNVTPSKATVNGSHTTNGTDLTDKRSTSTPVNGHSDNRSVVRKNGLAGEQINGHTNGHSNGHANGHSDEDTDEFTNGQTNGHANGQTNGQVNGHTNGHANGHANGHTNGHANGHSDDHANGFTNGHSNGSAVCALVNGDSP